MLGHWGLGWGKFLSIPLGPPCVPKNPNKRHPGCRADALQQPASSDFAVLLLVASCSARRDGDEGY